MKVVGKKSFILLGLLFSFGAAAGHPEGLFEVAFQMVPREGRDCSRGPSILPDRLAIGQSLVEDGLVASFVVADLEESSAYFYKAEFESVDNADAPQCFGKVTSISHGSAARFTMFLNGDGTVSGTYNSAQSACDYTFTGKRMVSLYDYPALTEEQEAPVTLAKVAGDYDVVLRNLADGKVRATGSLLLHDFSPLEDLNVSGAFTISDDFTLHFPHGLYDEARGALTLTGNQRDGSHRMTTWELRQLPTEADGKLRFKGYHLSLLQGRSVQVELIRR